MGKVLWFLVDMFWGSGSPRNHKYKRLDDRNRVASSRDLIDGHLVASLAHSRSYSPPTPAKVRPSPHASVSGYQFPPTLVGTDLSVVVSLDAQVRLGLAISDPPASRTVAVTVAVSPGAANTSESGESVIDTATCWIEAFALADAEPEVAVIVAVPSATEVTRPVEETVATDVDDELHDTLAPLIVAPFWSLTVAESWDVSPNEAKLKEVADSVIEVATGVGGVAGLVGVVPPSPHARSKRTAESRM